MREIKDLTINDGDNAYKFRLTQLSAISLQKWAFKAGVLLAGSGVLDADAENTDVTEIINVISKKGFSFFNKEKLLNSDTSQKEAEQKPLKRGISITQSA